MTDRLYGLGHIPDAPHIAATLRGVREMAAASPAVGFARPVEFIRQIRDQKATGSCVGQAMAQGFACRARAVGLNVPEVSALAIYRMARQGDNPVVDEGSAPSQAAYYAMARGLVPEARWPLAVASDGWTVTNVNDALPLDVWEHALDARVSEVGVVDLADADAVKHALDSGFGVAWSTVVDKAFDEFTSGALGPPSGTTRGRHYTLLVDYDDLGAIGVNSWSEDYGMAYAGFRGGFYRVSWDRLADPSSSDGRVIEAGPEVLT